MLDDTGVGSLCISVVHHRITLIISNTLQQFGFKTYCPVLQVSETIIEITVYLARINYLVCYGIKVFPVLKIICIKLHFDFSQQFLY